MRRSHKLYLEDILESANKIQHYVGDSSLENILQDKMRIDAIVRNLEIIGEASSKIPQEVKEKYSSIEWRKIGDFRNILTHEYFQIDLDILWDIVRNKIPPLIGDIKTILQAEQ